MKLKALQEKRNEIVNSMKVMTETAENFKVEDFNAKESELVEVENKIKALQKVETLTNIKIEKDGNDMDLRNSILEGKEIKLANEHTTAADGSVIKESYADTIEKKLVNVSPLYQLVRKIVTENPHNIPVQAGKLGKFVKTGELQKYVNQKANWKTVQLGAEKYTNLVTISEELLNDSGYDLEKELIDQLVEALALTLDELIVKGDGTVEGLETFTKENGAKEVVQGAAGVVTVDEVIDLFYALPAPYRQNACWVISDSMAKLLSKLKDGEGRPVLVQSYITGVLENTILGKPVIINEFVAEMTTDNKCMFFTNLNRALVIGLRKDMVIKKDESFLDDSVMIKANTRLDIKKLIDESVAYYVAK